MHPPYMSCGSYLMLRFVLIRENVVLFFAGIGTGYRVFLFVILPVGNARVVAVLKCRVRILKFALIGKKIASSVCAIANILLVRLVAI